MKLIINADDFGLTSGVTKGIHDCLTKGVLTSTTLMVTMPYFLDAVKIIRENSLKNIGLHLNISLGSPLTKCDSLVNLDNKFIKPKILTTDDKYKCEDICNEFNAQYQRFVKYLDQNPSHLDSHLYVHQIFEKVKKEIVILGEKIEVPVRDTDTKFYKKITFERNFKALKGENLDDMIDKFKNLIMKNKKLGVDVLELMVHPGYVDDDLMKISSYNLGRKLELDVLMSSTIRTFLENEKIQLISYLDLERN